MLDLIRGKAKLRNYSTYDLEWVPGTYELRICGVYDGERYFAYKSIADFLTGQLTSANRGRWFYAHAGGMADIQFIFDEIYKSNDYYLSASFSGSSAIIVNVHQGKNVWHFVDSFWLFRDSLANIGKSIGIRKTGPKINEANEEEVKAWYTNAPLYELVDYNKNDCVILWKAISEFEKYLLSIGGQLQKTIASCAMTLFRRSYLVKPIETNKGLNDIVKKSYYASRVEVFNSHCENARYYDINSSFPYAITFSQPGNLLEILETLPDYLLDDKQPFFADVSITVPDMYCPPIPYRIENRIFFPTGSWRAWLTGIDVVLLLQVGGTIDKVHEVLVFEPLHDLSNYAMDLYTKRKQSVDHFERITYKYLLNSLYGKFAESEFKDQIHINPGLDVLQKLDRDNMVMPGVWYEEREAKIPHQHVPISSYITARARKTLYDYMSQSDEFHYCDTDGFSTDSTYDESPELGGLKLEKIIHNGYFYHPKIYKLEGATPDGKQLRTWVKAKGFSLGKGHESHQRFDTLVRGLELEINRMCRIRENLRDNNLKPRDVKITKRVKFDTIPKRFTYPDGSTRPWHRDEIVID